MKCTVCEDSGWVCESHPRRLGKALTAAIATVLECRARLVTSDRKALRRGCQRASKPNWTRRAAGISLRQTASRTNPRFVMIKMRS
jgi:hypothetical protein